MNSSGEIEITCHKDNAVVALLFVTRPSLPPTVRAMQSRLLMFYGRRCAGADRTVCTTDSRRNHAL
jgi:hypothetical protein